MFTTIKALRNSSASPARIGQLENWLKGLDPTWPEDRIFPISLIFLSNGRLDYDWVDESPSTHVYDLAYGITEDFALHVERLIRERTKEDEAAIKSRSDVVEQLTTIRDLLLQQGRDNLPSVTLALGSGLARFPTPKCSFCDSDTIPKGELKTVGSAPSFDDQATAAIILIRQLDSASLQKVAAVVNSLIQTQ